MTTKECILQGEISEPCASASQLTRSLLRVEVAGRTSSIHTVVGPYLSPVTLAFDKYPRARISSVVRCDIYKK